MPAPRKKLDLENEIAERIAAEARENDEIYRAIPDERIDMAKIHFGHRKMLEWATAQIAPLAGRRILDVGVGEGHSSVWLAQQGAAVAGIEVSAVALERAERLCRRYGVQVDLRQMPGESLAFADESFDAILCMSAFHHMDMDLAAREFSRVLKPGGRVALVEPQLYNPPAWLYRQAVGWNSRAATSHERPLCSRDLEYLRRYFRDVTWRGETLLTLPLMAIDRVWENRHPVIHPILERIFDLVYPVDSAILRAPAVGHLAWKMLVRAEK